MILDEPTANLDPKSKKELVKIIGTLHKSQKITLVIATRDVDFIPLVADRAYTSNKRINGSVNLSV